MKLPCWVHIYLGRFGCYVLSARQVCLSLHKREHFWTLLWTILAKLMAKLQKIFFSCPTRIYFSIFDLVFYLCALQRYRRGLKILVKFVGPNHNCFFVNLWHLFIFTHIELWLQFWIVQLVSIFHFLTPFFNHFALQRYRQGMILSCASKPQLLLY